MANTASAKKAIRSSAKKRVHNLFWKNKVKKVVKELKKTKPGKLAAEKEAITKQLSTLQKNLDKAAKNNVIHKNKANRLKSRYAKKLTSSK